MAIGASFSADFSQIERAVGDVNVAFKTLTLTASSAQRAVTKIGDQFDGRRVITEANAAAKAVDALGGASKLTASEQSKLSATINEALAKYKALGQEAPASIRALDSELKDLADSQRRVDDATRGATGSFKEQVLGFAAGMATFEAARRALEGLKEFVAGSVDEYLDAQKALAGMRQSLIQAGEAAPDTIQAMSDLADEFERTTVHSDDLVREMEGLLVTVGHVAPQDMRRALTAASDLAAGLGIELRDATLLVAKATSGHAEALSRYGISIDSAAVSARGAAAVFDTLEASFGGQSQAQVDTYAGKLKQLENAWKDLKEAVGQAIVDNKEITDGLREAVPALRDFAGELGPIVRELKEIYDWYQKTKGFFLDPTGRGQQGLQAAGEALRGAVGELPSVTGKALDSKAVEAFRAHVLDLAASFGTLTVSGDAGLKMFQDWVTRSDAAAAAAKKAEADYQAWARSVTGLGAALEAAQLSDRFARLSRDGLLNAKAQDAIVAAYEKLRPELDHLIPSLEQLRTEHQKAIPVTRMQDEILRRLALVTLPDANRMFEVGQNRLKGFNDDGTLVSHTLVDISVAMKAVPFAVTTRQILEERDSLESLHQSLGDLSQAFGELAQISSGSLGTVIRFLGQLVSSANLAVESVQSIRAGFAAVHQANGSLTQTLSGITQITGGLVSAAAAAIQFGKALWDALTKSDAERAADELGRVWGVHISDQLAQSIEDTMKSKFAGMANNRWMAEVFHLGDIVDEVGVTADNVQSLIGQLRQAFVFLDEGSYSVQDVTSVLNDTFTKFAEFYTSRNALISSQLREIIRLDDEMGVHSQAVLQFVSGQAKAALDALSGAITARGDALDHLVDAQKALEDARAHGSADDVAKAQKAVADAQAKLAALPLTKAGASAFGSALFGTFEALVKGGTSALDAIRQIDPVIESLDKQLKKAGLDGGAAFAHLKSMAAIATDEVAGPSFTAIQQYGEALRALNNADILDQEQFSGLSEQITATYQAAVDALKKEGKDGSDALALVAPQLQTIWELQQDFGYSVDEATQKLLDQAIAAGEVGEKHRSIQAQTLDVLQHVADVLDAIGEKFGVEIPNQMDKMAGAADQTATKAERSFGSFGDMVGDQVGIAKKHFDEWIGTLPNKIRIPIEADLPEGQTTAPTRPYSLGGRVNPLYAAAGTFVSWRPRGSDTVPAMLTPGEYVMSRGAVNRLGAGLLDALNRGGAAGSASASAGEPTVVLSRGAIVYNGRPDDREVERLARAIIALGPRVLKDGGKPLEDWLRMDKWMAAQHGGG